MFPVGGAIHVDGGDILINDTVIAHSVAGIGAGLYASPSAHIQVYRSKFDGNNVGVRAFTMCKASGKLQRFRESGTRVPKEHTILPEICEERSS